MQGAFGDALKGVEQVEAVNTSATAAAVDAHLDMLRPAITSYGATVQVWPGNPNPSLPISLVLVGRSTRCASCLWSCRCRAETLRPTLELTRVGRRAHADLCER